MNKPSHEDGLTLPFLTYAAQVFGGEDRARAWMGTHNVELGIKPAVLATSVEGEHRIRAVLLKIEHGLSV